MMCNRCDIIILYENIYSIYTISRKLKMDLKAKYKKEDSKLLEGLKIHIFMALSLLFNAQSSVTEHLPL